MKATGFTTRDAELNGWPVRIISYCIGEKWFASVENADPGAKVARAEGFSRDEAEQIACGKAALRLGQTRRR